ncbi:MAG TPA: LON peptidase substrate-binding domain-containing protein [Pseudonocardiaceae bacterium]
MVTTLPLFPLGTVLLPGASLPLHIFEPRYRQLTVDLVTGAVPGRSFGVVAIKQGREVGDAGDIELHDIGCTAVLREARRLPDGRFDIFTSGERRFRLVEVDSSRAPYLMGTIEFVPDNEPHGEQRRLLPLLAEAARAAHRYYCKTAWRNEDWHEPEFDVEPHTLAHLLASDCLLALEDRQDLLEETCPVDRLRLVRRMLCREAEFLRELRAVPVPFAQFATESSRN